MSRLKEWLLVHATLEACDPDVCLLWRHKLTKGGYGTVEHGKSTKGAHNFVCEQVHGPAPEGRPQAAHSCGVRSCVNPHHLRWASVKENDADKDLHGTRPRGATHPRTKLSGEQVLAIRANPEGLLQYQLAERYGVGPTTISQILRGKRRASC
jgi:hypothetical protein